MPVRLLNSSVLVWPDAAEVDRAVRAWAHDVVLRHPHILRIGYHGSYARGTWGVGSDVDVVLIVAKSEEPFERRAARWDTTTLPVPVDLAVYTQAEWQELVGERKSLQKIAREVVWVSGES